jgi:predicted GNAT superfamily acetyltransferase
MGPRGEQQFGSLTLRTCHAVGEFRQALQLQKEVWNFEDVELVPVRLFVVGEKIGGHVLGAYDGKDMVGFAYGLPGLRGNRAYLHSHMLAVREQYRNSGVGRALKLFQRELCLQQGLELIEWTFDPLEIKNAYFNIERLGAIARRYTVNQYGITSSPLQGGLPSDRLIAEWWLKSWRVETCLANGSHPAATIVGRVEVPSEVAKWKADSTCRTKAAEAQSRIREALQVAFAQGLTIVAQESDSRGNGQFLLGRWDENWNYAEAEA